MDRIGDKRGFLWKMRLITYPVFIKSRYDAVAIFSNHPVESFLGGSQPVFSFLFRASALVRNSSPILKSLYLNGLSWQQTFTQ